MGSVGPQAGPQGSTQTNAVLGHAEGTEQTEQEGPFFLQGELQRRSWGWQARHLSSRIHTVHPHSPQHVRPCKCTLRRTSLRQISSSGSRARRVGWGIASSHQVRGVQHCHPHRYPTVRVLDRLRPQEVAGGLVHHHLLALSDVDTKNTEL